ncbi:hypothetical protein C1646_760821 [Rhizophagus diaphanus]|nr:hypothetical protein C1646_760821 [Rhizophagus diaphanus] [Rhizophagus sp. MUCL 43196]
MEYMKEPILVIEKVKLPALKIELIKYKHMIEEIDVFIESNGANCLVDWWETFRLINNEITMSKNTTNRKDAGTRTWRIKNFFKNLPTYATLWKREVYGISNNKCSQCLVFEETWICNKNNIISEMELFRTSITKILSDQSESDGIIREVICGLVNNKWLTSFKSSIEKKLTCMILDEYLNNIHDKIWIERCNETIALEKQIEKQKKNKKLKTLVKIDLEENIKDDVFILEIKATTPGAQKKCAEEYILLRRIIKKSNWQRTKLNRKYKSQKS